MDKSKNGTLRVIAIFKLFKAISLILVGISALKLIQGDAVSTLAQWIAMTGLNPGGRHIDELLGKVASLPPAKFKEFGVGSFVYAALFFIEGAGLWLEKRWAEWFTVAITGSLVPLEVYELYRHPTVGKACMLLVNLGVVAYLVIQIRKKNEG